MQAELDKKIVKEKGLEGQDLLDKKILALQVELGELANEWRGFKFWSENLVPTLKRKVKCDNCCGFKYITDHYGYEDLCEECSGDGYTKEYNPLLEEYV